MKNIYIPKIVFFFSLKKQNETYEEGKETNRLRRKKGNLEGKKRSEDRERDRDRDKGTNKKANKKLQRL